MPRIIRNTLLNYISDKGVTYFAFNLRINACGNNHGFYGKTCPICGEPLTRKESEAAYYCLNKQCDAKHIEGLIHYASRDAMNIEGFGDSITEDFYNMGYLKRINDYYTLDKYKEELMSLEGFGEKSIIKLLSSIEKSKENEHWKLVVEELQPWVEECFNEHKCFTVCGI